MRVTDGLAARLYEHPKIARAVKLLALLWFGSLWSLLTAPHASAAAMSEAMAWTGLHDSHNVPVGAYFVSVVPMMEAVRAQGPDFTMDPSSWGPALMSSMSTMMTYTQLAGWLSIECAALIFIASAAIWFIKFALSAQWLGWLAAIASPLVTNVTALVNRLYVMPIALLACCLVGGVVALTKGVGRGVGIIIGGLLVVLASAALLHDPVNEMVSDNGVLGIGRSLGFAVAQGGFHNGPIAAGGTSAQLDTLGSWLVDVLLRQQIQMINFGMVVDDYGCGQLWDGAIMSGQISAPAEAMRGCAPAALAHAQQLDATTVGWFAMLIAAVLIVTFALVYIGCEVFRIGFKAFVNLLVIIPAAAVAVAPGPPRNFAKRTAVKLVVHGVEMLAATAGLGIVVIIMSEVTRGSIPGTIGMTHPLAKLFVMMLLAVAGALGFRHLLHAFGDRGVPGPVSMATGALGRAARTGDSLDHIDYLSRRGRQLWQKVADGGHQQRPPGSDTDNTAVGAPGRRGHPPTGEDPKPGPQDQPPGAAPAGGPPPTAAEGGSGAALTPAQANRAARQTAAPASAGSSAASGPSVAAATQVATAVAAPEVVAASAIAERLPRGGGSAGVPGRRPDPSGAGRSAGGGDGSAVPSRGLPPGRGPNGNAPARPAPRRFFGTRWRQRAAPPPAARWRPASTRAFTFRAGDEELNRDDRSIPAFRPQRRRPCAGGP